ncbi:MAG: ABC transporter permease, partial [Deltaproteobacteria bacterium]|nr:ABC transporter permease [Deltaproteobacteria bacterium]
MTRLLLAIPFLLLVTASAAGAETLTVGGKKFTEGYVLTELYAQLIEANTAYRVERKSGLGGTTVCFEALRTGAIDLYPEYSGTIQEVLLKSPRPLGLAEADRALRTRFGVAIGPSLGFNNTYAFAVREDVAARGVRSIGDLARHPELRFGLSHEFLRRADGWPAVAKAYGLRPAKVSGLDHGLAYEALRDGAIDVIDAYSTDAKLARYRLTVLQDDRRFFPAYLAVPLTRLAAIEGRPELAALLDRLAGRIDDETMRAMNAAVEIDGRPIGDVAREFLTREGLIAEPSHAASTRTLPILVAEHLGLTGIAVLAALLV